MKFLKRKEDVALHYSVLFIVLCYIIFSEGSWYKIVPFIAYFIYFLMLRYVEKKETLALLNKILLIYITIRFISLIFVIKDILTYGMIYIFNSFMDYIFTLLLEIFIFYKILPKKKQKKDNSLVLAFSFSVLSILYIVVELSLYYILNKGLSVFLVMGCIVCLMLRLLLIRYFYLLK